MAGGCVKRPKGVLSDSKMVGIVADLELSEAYLQQNPQLGERDKEALVEYVISKHGVSRADFDSTMSWYGRNMDAYYDLYGRVERELTKRKRKSAGADSYEHAATGDIWPYSRMALLSPLSGSDAFEFSIPTGDIEKGEQLELSMRLRTPAAGTSIFGVEYSDGTKSYLSRTLSSSRRLKLKLQTDTGRRVSRVFGNVLLNSERDMPLWIDSIYILPLGYDSMEYYNIHMQRTVAKQPK